MKLFLAPGACSLADHIALCEAGMAFERVKVDIPTRRTEAGEDFTRINPKGYVPALLLDDGQVLTENTAILAWIAEQAPALVPDGALGRIRLVEMLAFIAAEIHKPFVRIMFPTGDADKALASELVQQRLRYLAERLKGEFLFGDRVSAADAYLLVMLRWAAMLGVGIPEPLPAFVERMNARPAVQRALRDEGLS